jgi:DNA-binding beta-propeller fold protein YncE
MVTATVTEAVTLRFVSSFGQATGLGRPCGIAIGPSNLIAVADPGYSQILRFREDGTLFDSFGKGEGGWFKKVGRVRNPTGVAVDRDGCTWVADVGAQPSELGNAISKFDPDGRYLLTVGHKGSGEGEFHRPRTVKFDRDGCFWVVDAYNHRLQRFDATGRFLQALGHRGSDPGGGGAFEDPSDLAFDEHGFLWVTDTFNNRVQILEPDGRFVGQFGREGRGDGEFQRPRGIAIDRGIAFVTDVLGNRVQAFDRDGRFLASFGSQGPQDRQFNQPYGVAILGRQLLVADNQNARIMRLGLE